MRAISRPRRAAAPIPSLCAPRMAPNAAPAGRCYRCTRPASCDARRDPVASVFAAVIRPSPRSAAVAGLAALAALLGALTATTAFGLLGWGVAATCGVGLCLGMTRALAFEAQPHLGPADLVTLARGLMACAVAGLTAHLLTGSEVTPAILMPTVPARLLDPVAVPY